MVTPIDWWCQWRALVWVTLALAAIVTAGTAFDRAFAASPADQFALPATDDGLPGAGPIRRYDWFQQRWQQRRSAWAREAGADHGAVVFLGDSITEGWGDGLAAAFPGLRTANRGIGGDTTRGVLIRIKEDVLALDPQAVVLLVGTNDLEEGAAPEVAADNLRLILDELARPDPNLPIVLCQVLPSSAARKRPAGLIKALNSLYLEVARGRPGVIFLDTWPLFANAEGDANAAEFPDLLHPNELGYAKWAAALRPIFATFGLSEETPDSFALEPGFVSLFNGRDLTGWGYRPTAPAEIEAAARRDAGSARPPARFYVDSPVSFQGREATPDGRYIVRAGRLVVTTPPEYRKIQQLWTEEGFPGDFVLKLEFRATPNADSGVFIRGTQLQVRDYRIAGPYQQLQRYRPQEWNELTVTVRGNTAECWCNGELLEQEFKVPATGPIGLEGDRGQMEYRRIRLQKIQDR